MRQGGARLCCSRGGGALLTCGAGAASAKCMLHACHRCPVRLRHVLLCAHLSAD